MANEDICYREGFRSYGAEALCHAIAQNNIEIFKLLFEKGLHLTDSQFSQNLIFPASEGRTKIVKKLFFYLFSLFRI